MNTITAHASMFSQVHSSKKFAKIFNLQGRLYEANLYGQNSLDYINLSKRIKIETNKMILINLDGRIT